MLNLAISNASANSPTSTGQSNRSAVGLKNLIIRIPAGRYRSVAHLKMRSAYHPGVGTGGFQAVRERKRAGTPGDRRIRHTPNCAHQTTWLIYCPKCLGLNLNDGKYRAARRKLSGLSRVMGSPAQRDQISELLGFIRTVSASQSATSSSVNLSATASNFRRPAWTRT